MKPLLSIVAVLLSLASVYAEGTAQLRPTVSSLYCNLEIKDGTPDRPFALYTNTDSLHRLYIHIGNVSETVYLGFNVTTTAAANGRFRIKDPSGNIVYAETMIPKTVDPGFIQTYAEAVAGPKIGGVPAAGYSPLSFSPTTTGDFYIEFQCDGGSTYHFDLFDITVVDASNHPIKGRLWSYAWDLSARGGTNPVYTTFYIYTSDQYISAVDLNGMQPYGFVIACNSTGPGTSGSAALNRQSITGNSISPEYKIFLNKPDINEYEVAQTPSMVEDLTVIGSPIANADILFYLNMNKPGTVEIFLDLDGVSGFQAGGQDVLLVENINAGGDTIIWNGKDAQGNWVLSDVTVEVTSRFSTGVTNLPLFDPEYHPNGYKVYRIQPDSARASVYWDDTSISGTTEFDGVMGDTEGHNFPSGISGGYGNERTINTWWNGYENNNLKSFSFQMDGTTFLPIELVSFDARLRNNSVIINWLTASEKNSSYFVIERSTDLIHFESIGAFDAAGYSDYKIAYQFTDMNPLIGTSYYRLTQVDFDQTRTSYDARTVDYEPETEILVDSENHIVKIQSKLPSDKVMVSLYDLNGNPVSFKQTNMGYKLEVTPDEEISGYFVIQVQLENKNHRQKILFQ